MNQSELTQAIRQFVADGKTEEALDLFRETIGDINESMLSDVTLLESRFQNAKSDFLVKGILSREDYARTEAQINYAILELLEQLEKSSYTQQGGAKDKSSGRILHNIPGIMPLNRETRCIVRLAYDDETLTKGFKSTADTVIESVRISEVMGVELLDFNETPSFQIRTITEEEQFLTCDDFTQWIFQVKPILEGKYPLTLKVTVIEKIDGRERKRDIVLEKEIFIISQPVAIQGATPQPAPAAPIPQASSATSNYQIGFEETNLHLNYVASDQAAAAATAAEPVKKRASTAIVSAVATVIFAITGFFIYNNTASYKTPGQDVVTAPDPQSNGSRGSQPAVDTISINDPSFRSQQGEIAASTEAQKPELAEDDAAMPAPNAENSKNAATTTPTKKSTPLNKKQPIKKNQNVAIKVAPQYTHIPNDAKKNKENTSSTKNAKSSTPPNDDYDEMRQYKVKIKVRDEMVNAEILVNGEKPTKVKKNFFGTPQYVEFQSRKRRQTFIFKTGTLTCKVENIEITGPETLIEACSVKK